jgi:hypothetical protein
VCFSTRTAQCEHDTPQARLAAGTIQPEHASGRAGFQHEHSFSTHHKHKHHFGMSAVQRYHHSAEQRFRASTIEPKNDSAGRGFSRSTIQRQHRFSARTISAGAWSSASTLQHEND